MQGFGFSTSQQIQPIVQQNQTQVQQPFQMQQQDNNLQQQIPQQSQTVNILVTDADDILVQDQQKLRNYLVQLKPKDISLPKFQVNLENVFLNKALEFKSNYQIDTNLLYEKVFGKILHVNEVEDGVMDLDSLKKELDFIENKLLKMLNNIQKPKKFDAKTIQITETKEPSHVNFQKNNLSIKTKIRAQKEEQKWKIIEV